MCSAVEHISRRREGSVGTCTWHLMRVWNLLRAQVSLTNPVNETGAELYMLGVLFIIRMVSRRSVWEPGSLWFLLSLGSRLGRENKSMQIFFPPFEQKTH
jgi:hypothetical protein